MFLIVVYDITDDKRRSKIDKTLGSYGIRVNLSVFEVKLKNKTKLTTLVTQIESIIDKKEDSVRIYFLDKASAKKSIELGSRSAPFTQESGYVF